jgi:hypothetical protein
LPGLVPLPARQNWKMFLKYPNDLKSFFAAKSFGSHLVAECIGFAILLSGCPLLRWAGPMVILAFYRPSALVAKQKAYFCFWENNTP